MSLGRSSIRPDMGLWFESVSLQEKYLRLYLGRRTTTDRALLWVLLFELLDTLFKAIHVSVQKQSATRQLARAS
jgi:hypothetical protein